ncbi:hypothetical protein TNCT_601311 [Trichonephila clavata]|uniref:Secreted protein n=1 Tax=Trichonephila clavata TaxID=2740835 RepID=A0A8X6F5L6_TRICU|nr:hypothetical protein TNCT_601311 [Trichonephila clavata]
MWHRFRASSYNLVMCGLPLHTLWVPGTVLRAVEEPLVPKALSWTIFFVHDFGNNFHITELRYIVDIPVSIIPRKGEEEQQHR